MNHVLDVLTLGETMGLLSSARPGLLRHQRAMELSVGGSEFNTAVGVSRLGMRSGWIGRVGDDELGALVHRELLAEGVFAAVVVDPAAPTGLMLKEQPRAGARRVRYYRSGSAGSRLRPDDVDADLVAGARIVHVSAITPALSNTAAGAVTRVVELARASGALVSLDLNYRSALWAAPAYRAAVAPLLERADLVFGSPEEVALALDEPPVNGGPEHAARALAGRGPATVVLRQGADGAVAVVDGEVLRGPAPTVEVVDPVGAGDAFVAGWLVAHLEGRPAVERLRTGLLAGAYACTALGDWEGAPTGAALAAADTGVDVLR